MVAFALLMTPFATNPLIYVASDPNYRRCPQIDTPNHLKAQTVINQRSNRAVNERWFFRAYSDCLCQPLRRNSMAEVDLLLANKLIISNPILLFPGLDNPDCLAKCETLSGGACPSSPGYWHHWHLHQPPPSSLHSQLQDPHHLLLVCLTLSLLSKSSCIHS